MVAAALVAGPDDGSYAPATTDQDKYNPDHVTDAILYIDLEICKTRQSTVGDGYRGQYGSAIAVANGATITPHPGKIAFVEIKKLSTSSFQRGILATSIEALNRLLENSDSRYGSASINGGRYFIDEEMRLRFTGFSCQIFVPTDLAITAACQAPAVDEMTIKRGAVWMLTKDGVDASIFAGDGQQYVADLARIRGESAAIPPLDMFIKQGG